MFSQLHLKDKDDALVESFTRELVDVRAMFRSQQKTCPSHVNMPPVVSKLMWLHALKQRIQVHEGFSRNSQTVYSTC